jgi:hypothetical protein
MTVCLPRSMVIDLRSLVSGIVSVRWILAMSALGHELTSEDNRATAALYSEADMLSPGLEVRFVPIAEVLDMAEAAASSKLTA